MSQTIESSGASWKGQQLKHQQTFIDSVDARVRIIAASVFAVSVVVSNHFSVLIVGLLIGLGLAIAAKLKTQHTLRRVVAMDLFMVFLIVLLPFTTPVTAADDILFSIGTLDASKEGLFHALMIALKANAVLLALMSLVGTMSATTLGNALAQLKVPDKLVHLLLFTVRYLDVIGQEYKRMRRAMKARAFVLKTNQHTWRSMGYLIGMLVVHSVERSERIMDAMKCRGYKGHFYLADAPQLERCDLMFVLVCMPILGMLVGLNFL